MKKLACALMALSLVACGQAVETKTADLSERQNFHAKEIEFELTSEQFTNAFNAAARSYGQSFRINKVDVQHGSAHDYFQQTLASGISLTAVIAKDSGRITSVTALVSDNNASNVLAISEVVAATVNPRLDKNKTSALVTDMMKEAGSNNEAGKFPQRFVNNTRYVLRNSSGIGYWWIANPV